MTRYIVMHACAPMPTSCWGEYRRVAVVELEPGFDGRPKFIGEHARGVARVVKTWEKMHVGSTSRCAFQKALSSAKEMADRMNAERHGFSRQEDR
jgi:hypothetical protein